MWKIRYTTDDDQWHTFVGHTEEDFDRAPWFGIQVISVSKDIKLDGKSRVLWYRDMPGIFGEYGYYGWDPAGFPIGMTPDAVLDKWRAKTGRTDVRLVDLSLDDYRSIKVKIGRNTRDEMFEEILQDAVNDPEIP